MTHFRRACLVMAVLTVAACASGGGTQSQANKSRENAARYNLQLGVTYLQQGNLALAKDKLDRSLKQNPRDPNLYSARALLAERLGHLRDAEKAHASAMRLAPNDPEINNNYAVFLCRTQRADEGVKRFLASAQNRLYSTPWVAYTNAAVCLRDAKSTSPQIEQYLRQALQLRPNHAEAELQLGSWLLAQNRSADAASEVQRFLGSFRPTPELLYLGVEIARRQQDKISEIKYSRQLRLEFPDSAQARALATSPGKGG
ncbi:MAG: type IV pilus biogenesis/stability protein PilW [Steroidobacteraceae bacterium]